MPYTITKLPNLVKHKVEGRPAEFDEFVRTTGLLSAVERAEWATVRATQLADFNTRREPLPPCLPKVTAAQRLEEEWKARLASLPVAA